MRVDYQLAALASPQAGFLSRKQMDGLGLSEAAIRWRVDRGVLEVIRKGLYHVDGMTGDYKAHVRAAMAILPDPTISHETAAEMHGIPYVPRRRAVVTVHGRTTHNFPGVQVHRSIDLIDEHRQLMDSLWVTTPARTLVDEAANLHPIALRNATGDALASGLVSIGELQSTFNQVARRGRIGIGAMRLLLNDLVGSDMIAASRLERLGMRVFALGDLPKPVWQYPAPWDSDKRIDFAWPHVFVGCECDSRRWHTRIDDFQRDRERDNLSLVHGWRIFRFTWDDFTKRPDQVVTQLRVAIEA